MLDCTPHNLFRLIDKIKYAISSNAYDTLKYRSIYSVFKASGPAKG